MKIVHITRKFLEGFAYQDNELVTIHAQMGHHVTVITSETDDSSLHFDMSLIRSSIALSEERKGSSYNIIRLPLKRRINPRFWEFKNLFLTLEHLAPDLIFFHGIPVLCLWEIARYKRRYPQTKVFMDCHTDYNNSAHSFLTRNILHRIIYRYVIQLTSKQIERYYYITPNTKKFMLEMYSLPEEKLYFLPLGGNMDKINYANSSQIRSNIRKSLGIADDAIVVVSGGKLDVKKKSHNLAEAINNLNNPNVHLILFGIVDKGYESLLHTSIGNNQNIHLTGWVSSGDVYNYFLSADIACFPGSQSVLWIQAICCGLPLIVKNWQNDTGYLNIADNVLFLQDSDTVCIEKALNDLIDDKEKRSQMRYNAINVGRHYFSYQRIAQMIIDDSKL